MVAIVVFISLVGRLVQSYSSFSFGRSVGLQYSTCTQPKPTTYPGVLSGEWKSMPHRNKKNVEDNSALVPDDLDLGPSMEVGLAPFFLDVHARHISTTEASRPMARLRCNGALKY